MKQPSKRFNRDDWITTGLAALREHGPDTITIEGICEHAGKTRGSFYFHFETIDDFLVALAENWRETFSTQVIKRALPSPETLEKLDLLNQLAARLDPAIETGMRRLALRNTSVAETVHAADDERVEYLAKLYIRAGYHEKRDAKALAKIEYAAFTGFRLIDPEMTPDQSRELYGMFLKLTGR